MKFQNDFLQNFKTDSEINLGEKIFKNIQKSFEKRTILCQCENAVESSSNCSIVIVIL